MYYYYYFKMYFAPIFLYEIIQLYCLSSLTGDGTDVFLQNPEIAEIQKH